MIAPLAAWTSKVQAKEATLPFTEVVDHFRQGPPRWSPFSIPAVDSAANIIEFVVHSEDVRRATPGWQARECTAELNQVLWTRLPKLSRLLLHGLPMGITVQRTDIQAPPAAIKTGSPVVTITGSPLDLVLALHGRSAVNVEIDGDSLAVAEFKSAKFGS